MIIKVKPQAKKARIEPRSPEKASNEPSESEETRNSIGDRPHEAATIGLVSYSDESEDED